MTITPAEDGTPTLVSTGDGVDIILGTIHGIHGTTLGIILVTRGITVHHHIIGDGVVRMVIGMADGAGLLDTTPITTQIIVTEIQRRFIVATISTEADHLVVTLHRQADLMADMKITDLAVDTVATMYAHQADQTDRRHQLDTEQVVDHHLLTQDHHTIESLDALL